MSQLPQVVQSSRPPRPSQVVETRVTYAYPRPHDAHPTRPVHLYRVYSERLDTGAWREARREFVDSYPTQELAEGRAIKDREYRHRSYAR